jgi:3-methyladenine DNA glycosylase AlkD
MNRLRPRDTATIRRLRRQISKELAPLDRAGVLALARDLVDSGDNNARWVAYELVRDHAASMARITATEIERLGAGLCGWDGVDAFSCFISGRAWRMGRISDAAIRRWARSKDRWWRRAALVSTIPLNVRSQGGTGDVARTLAVCELLLDDRDEMVTKAMSWALRALSVRDAAAVAKFVEKHEGRLAALVKREVRNKLRTGLKNPKTKPARSASSGRRATSP